MHKKADDGAQNKKFFKLSKKKTLNTKKSDLIQNTNKNINNKLKTIFIYRKSNSLDKLTKKFIRIVNEGKTNIIDLQDITEKMNVYKRRIYDITNVFKGNSIYIYIIYFHIGIGLIKNIKNCQIQINPKFYEFYGNYINKLKEEDDIKENNNKNKKIKKSELTKINNEIKRISFFMEKINMDLSKRKINKNINNKINNNNNLFLITKDLYKKNNLDFIGKKFKTEIANNSDIDEKKVDKKDIGNYSNDFIFSSDSLKKIYNISNNKEFEFESIMEEEGDSEKGDDSFLNKKLINHKRLRFPSIPFVYSK